MKQVLPLRHGAGAWLTAPCSFTTPCGMERAPPQTPKASQTGPRASEKLALHTEQYFIPDGNFINKLRLRSSQLEAAKKWVRIVPQSLKTASFFSLQNAMKVEAAY